MPIFPTEIFREILFFVFACDIPANPSTPPTGRFSPLRKPSNILCVSSAFYELSLPFLWSTLTIATQKDWVRFFDFSGRGFSDDKKDRHQLAGLLTYAPHAQENADRVRTLLLDLAALPPANPHPDDSVYELLLEIDFSFLVKVEHVCLLSSATLTKDDWLIEGRDWEAIEGRAARDGVLDQITNGDAYYDGSVDAMECTRGVAIASLLDLPELKTFSAFWDDDKNILALEVPSGRWSHFGHIENLSEVIFKSQAEIFFYHLPPSHRRRIDPVVVPFRQPRSRLLHTYPRAKVTLVDFDDAELRPLRTEAQELGEGNCWKVESDGKTVPLLV